MAPLPPTKAFCSLLSNTLKKQKHLLSPCLQHSFSTSQSSSSLLPQTLPPHSPPLVCPYPHSPSLSLSSSHCRIPHSVSWVLSSTPSPLFLTSPSSLLSQMSTPLYFPRDVCIQGAIRDISEQASCRRQPVDDTVKAGIGFAKIIPKEKSASSDFVWSSHEVFNWSNAISFGRLLSGPVLAWMIVHGFSQEALVGLLLAGASDWLDGYIARKKGTNSVLGSYLDPFADKVLVGSIVLSMAYSGLLHPALVVLVVARDGALIVGAFFHRAYSMGWKFNSWREFFYIGEGGIEKIEPLFISKVNTVLQLALIGTALLQPALAIPDTFSLIPSLSWLVAFTTCASWLGYGFKYLRKRTPTVEPAGLGVVPLSKPANGNQKRIQTGMHLK